MSFLGRFSVLWRLFHACTAAFPCPKDPRADTLGRGRRGRKVKGLAYIKYTTQETDKVTYLWHNGSTSFGKNALIADVGARVANTAQKRHKNARHKCGTMLRVVRHAVVRGERLLKILR